MHAFICTTCGTQYEPSAQPPAACMICEEERQYVGTMGQAWTTLARLQQSHMATFHDEGGLIGIGTSPGFGIGQRALLVPTETGNILWDCISLIDDAMVQLLNGLGGIEAIAISHPHYYTTMVEWSRAFGNIPVYLHRADAEWIMRQDDCLELWDGSSKEIASGVTLVRTGGHYEGGTVMHLAKGPTGKGALLSGDLLQVVADRKFLGFMRSYPNFIPLGEAAVRAVAATVEPYDYDAVYGAFWGRVIPAHAKAAMRASVDRHVEWLNKPAL
jgi:glyoxylase-like metal-dependent hydrolase (beta-lactamase superfamily II)